MHPDEYKAACRHPDAFSRPALEETARLLHAHAPALVPLIERALAQPPVPKPDRHSGGPATDFLRVDIGRATAEFIRDAFVEREVAAVTPGGETTALASHFAGMADAWTDYLVWLDGDAA